MNGYSKKTFKRLLSTVLTLFFMPPIFAQLSNIKSGLWSDKSVWNNNTIPTGLDDVKLQFSITVDINGSCRSLNLNGNNIIINSGVNLQILGNGTAAIDSTYLSKAYGILVDASTIDTIQVTTYNYDNLKRVTSVVDTIEDFYAETLQSIYYSYNLNDSIPYKSQLFRISADDPGLTEFSYDTITTYHFYDNYGKNLKDSVIKSRNSSNFGGYSSTYTIKTYSYGINKIFGTSFSFPINVPNDSYVPRDQLDTATLDSYGNIINNMKYTYDKYSQLWKFNAVSIFSYDAGQSPFAGLSNFKTFGVFPSGETLFFDLPQNKNKLTQNETHSISDNGIGSRYAYNYINLYGSDGTLNQVQAYDVPPIPGTFTKVTFEYKNL